MVKILRNALLSALEASKNVHPNEFIGFFREEKGVFTELVLAPLATYGRSHAFFWEWHLPIDFSLKASFHSHPGNSCIPSESDLNFFSKTPLANFIACFPYSLRNVKCFDERGSEIEFQLID